MVQVDVGGTPLNNLLIDFCALLRKSGLHFHSSPMPPHHFQLWMICQVLLSKLNQEKNKNKSIHGEVYPWQNITGTRIMFLVSVTPSKCLDTAKKYKHFAMNWVIAYQYFFFLSSRNIQKKLYKFNLNFN